MAAALEATEALVDEAPVKKAKASGSKPGRPPARRPPARAASPASTLRWLTPSRLPDQGRPAPPDLLLMQWGVSLAITWRLFKAQGWVATGKGGGKPAAEARMQPALRPMQPSSARSACRHRPWSDQPGDPC